MCRQREKSAGKSGPSRSSGKSSGRSGTSREAQTSAVIVDRSVIDDLIAPVENRVAASVASVAILSHVCRSSGGNASARAVEAEPAEPEEEREIQHVWALSVCDISGIPLDVLSVCDNSDPRLI